MTRLHCPLLFTPVLVKVDGGLRPLEYELDLLEVWLARGEYLLPGYRIPALKPTDEASDPLKEPSFPGEHQEICTNYIDRVTVL